MYALRIFDKLNDKMSMNCLPSFDNSNLNENVTDIMAELAN